MGLCSALKLPVSPAATGSRLLKVSGASAPSSPRALHIRMPWNMECILYIRMEWNRECILHIRMARNMECILYIWMEWNWECKVQNEELGIATAKRKSISDQDF